MGSPLTFMDLDENNDDYACGIMPLFIGVTYSIIGCSHLHTFGGLLHLGYWVLEVDEDIP